MKRNITGFFWGLFLLAIWYFQGAVLRVALSLMMIEGMREVFHAFDTYGDHTYWWPGITFSVLSMPVYVFFGWEAACILMFLCIISGMTTVILHGEADFNALIATVFPMLYPGMLFLMMFRMQDLPVPEYASLCISITFLVPALCDVAAFEVGSHFGKHKLCPRLSPNKTIEGAVGGMVGAVLGIALLCALYSGTKGVHMPPWWQLVPLGILCGFASQCGDLAASLIKRRCGIKDYAKLLPGHGGLMDRMDSSLMCCVVVYGYFFIFCKVFIR